MQAEKARRAKQNTQGKAKGNARMQGKQVAHGRQDKARQTGRHGEMGPARRQRNRHADNQSTAGRQRRKDWQATQHKARHECMARDKSRQVVKED